MKRPPKNITSWTRKSHIPNVTAPFCCAMLSNWCAGRWWPLSGLRDKGASRERGARRGRGVGGRPFERRRREEVLGRGRRAGLPLEPLGPPRARDGGLAIAERPDQVRHREQVARAQDGRAGRRHHVEDLEL